MVRVSPSPNIDIDSYEEIRAIAMEVGDKFIDPEAI